MYARVYSLRSRVTRNSRERALIVFGAMIALLTLFGWFVPHAQAGSTTLVISEFRTRGPNTASDEFIELFN